MPGEKPGIFIIFKGCPVIPAIDKNSLTSFRPVLYHLTFSRTRLHHQEGINHKG